jgi:HAD superfamily hydrolase (TIGR01509 family)
VKTDDDIRKYFGAGADRIFAEIIPDPLLAKKAFRHYLDFNRGKEADCAWHDGMLKVVDEIKARKIPTAIVTGRHSEDLGIVAKPLGLGEYFSVQICDDHLAKSKPDPEGIRLACQKLGLSPAEVLYVGDSKGDLDAARAAGAVSVAALWDKTVNAKLLSDHSDHVANHPADVLKIFASLTSLHGSPIEK